MEKFLVEVAFTGWSAISIEAGTKKEAIEKAQEILGLEEWIKKTNAKEDILIMGVSTDTNIIDAAQVAGVES